MTDKEKTITTELEKYKAAGTNLLLPSTHISGLSEFHAHPAGLLAVID